MTKNCWIYHIVDVNSRVIRFRIENFSISICHNWPETGPRCTSGSSNKLCDLGQVEQPF